MTRGPCRSPFGTASSSGEPDPVAHVQPYPYASEVDGEVTIGLGLLVLVHAADYFTFLVMVMDHGIAAEANPIVALLAQQYGLPLLTVAKAAAVLLMVTVVIVAARQRPRVAASVLSVGIAVGSVGAISNIASF